MTMVSTDNAVREYVNVRKDELPMQAKKQDKKQDKRRRNSKFELLGLLPSVARIAEVAIRRSLEVLRLL